GPRYRARRWGLCAFSRHYGQSLRNGWRDVVQSRQLPRERGTRTRFPRWARHTTQLERSSDAVGVSLPPQEGRVPAPSRSPSRPGPPGTVRIGHDPSLRKLPAARPCLQAATQVIHVVVTELARTVKIGGPLAISAIPTLNWGNARPT